MLPLDDPLPKDALTLFRYVYHRGGSLRLRHVQAGTGLDDEALRPALYELQERYWITIMWRPPTVDESSTLAELVERITVTRFGRRKYRKQYGTSYVYW
jgi:hypothetical protein